MQIIKSKQIESVAIEIIDKTHKNTIVICIYKHPNLSVADFNEDYLQHLLDKLSYERKNIILLGDFNIDLLHYETDYQTRNFLDKMYSNSLAPKITIPTRLTTHSKTLIDNFFDTNTDENSNAGNLTSPISDHLAQFLTYTNRSHRTTTISKQVRFKRNLKVLSHDAFKKELQINWHEILKIEDENPDTSLEIFLNLIHTLLDKHISLIKMTSKETKLQNKPWISQEILKNINKKNKLYHKFCKAKDPARKEQLHEEFKVLRNTVTNSLRESKENYYRKYFEDNKLNLRKIWNGIKEIINLKKSNKSQPRCIKINEIYITDQNEIAKNFNKHFATIAEKIDNKTPKSKQKVTDYLKHRNLNSFFLKPVNEKEIQNIISNTANNKAVGPNSVPNFLLKQFKEELSIPLSLIINMSFKTGIFP